MTIEPAAALVQAARTSRIEPPSGWRGGAKYRLEFSPEVAVPELAATAEEAFQILRSFDYTVRLLDADEKPVTEPAEARRMYAGPDNMMVSLFDDGDNSALRLFVGKSTEISAILGLLRSLRACAVKFGLEFSCQRFGHEIVPREMPPDPVREAARRIAQHLIEAAWAAAHK